MTILVNFSGLPLVSVYQYFFFSFCRSFQEAENTVAAKVKELAKSRTDCAEKEATIAAMKIDLQTLNKALEEAKNKVQNSEEEVR